MLTLELQAALSAAMMEAQERKHEYVTLEHVLLALTHDERGLQVLRHVGADVAALRKELESYLDEELERLTDPPADYEPMPTAAFQRALRKAVMQVRGAGRDEADGGDLLIALFAERNSHAVGLLEEQGVGRLALLEYVAHGISSVGPDETSRPVGLPAGGEDDEDGPGVAANPLEAYCVELVDRAANGKLDVLVGRDVELKRAMQVLCRRRKNNPVFVGEAGVGKTAIVEGLAQRIADEKVPELLRDSTIYSLDVGAMLAGTRFRGDFEERVKGVLDAITSEEKAILFVDEIHNLLGAGSTSSGTMDAGNMLKPALSSGELRCIGSTTFDEYKRFEKDRALARRFQRVDVPEPTSEDCLAILQGLKPRYEEHHGVRFTAPALRAIVRLSVKHLPDRHLPDKAIDVMDEAGAAERLRPKSRRHATIGVKQIEEVVASMARIPIAKAKRDDREQLQQLETHLKTVVFGQDSAIAQLVAAVHRSRAGLGRPDKPTGSFLFTGPTGVGKTELAKQLSWQLGVNFERFDMSEFMEKHAVARLIGAPPGYVGFEQGGLLIDAVRKNPHGVILLDEIEKAHPDLFNILLQVMDHAELTDNQGRKADFSHVTLIMTSNVGARELSGRSVGFGDDDRSSQGDKAVERAFSPEFRNRLDAVVRFGHLAPEVMLLVVDKFLIELEAQLSERRVALEVSDAARAWLAERGYDKVFGARPMARLIQEKIKSELAEELLFGKLENGGVVHVGEQDGELSFEFEPRT
jgi:ATP-dependent Clp protease ATP-binding subunit ClpA